MLTYNFLQIFPLTPQYVLLKQITTYQKSSILSKENITRCFPMITSTIHNGDYVQSIFLKLGILALEVLP